MKPNQKKLDEFLLDLIEFVGKHYPNAFSRTKMMDSAHGIAVLIKNEKQGSELEISTERSEITFQFGPVCWRIEGCLSAEELFSKTISELLSVLGGKTVLITGKNGEDFVRGNIYRDRSEADAIAEFKIGGPSCESIILKAWKSGICD